MELPVAEVADEICVGDFIAYLEEEGDACFHIGKVTSKGDDVVIDTYATPTRNLAQAKWKPLEQIVATEQYTLQTSARRHQVQVQDTFPKGDIAKHVVLPKMEMLPSSKIGSDSRRKLMATGKSHHKLGKTFP